MATFSVCWYGRVSPSYSLPMKKNICHGDSPGETALYIPESADAC